MYNMYNIAQEHFSMSIAPVRSRGDGSQAGLQVQGHAASYGKSCALGFSAVSNLILGDPAES
jgi:hypothetical protein